DIKELTKLELSQVSDSSTQDTTHSAIPCSCDNELRYNVSGTTSENYPITKVTTCQTMVSSAGAPKGGWFSKVTLDPMFCHAPDANGIFVYKGNDSAGNPVFIAEAARDTRIQTVDDGVSFMYYTRTLCPTVCGKCYIAN